MNKYIQNHRGLTLVELLATVVIISLIAIIGTSILISSIKKYDDIAAENTLRDEADIILAQFYREIYPKRESELDKVIVDGVLKKSSIKNDPKINTPVVGVSVNDSSIVFKYIDENNIVTYEKFGFEGSDVIIKNNKHQFNPNIKLVTKSDDSTNYSKITNSGENGYVIKLVLKNTKKNLVRTFEHQLSTINDIEEGGS